MQENFEWFVENYDDIYRLCGECHVVIQDKKIIKIFSSEIEGDKWLEKNDLVEKVNFQYCNGEESGYTMYW